MIYALVQTEFGAIDVSILADALKAIGVNQVDAPVQAANAKPGFPGFGLSEEDATTLRNALSEHGIETEAIQLPDLTPLPDARTFNRGYVSEGGFVAIDMYDREYLVPWKDIKTVAVGEVVESQIINSLSSPSDGMGSAVATVGRAALNTASAISIAAGGYGIFVMKKAAKSQHAEVGTGVNIAREVNYMLEVVGSGEVPRIRMRATKFDYGCLGETMTQSADENFVELLRWTSECVPDSVSLDNNLLALISDDDDLPLFGFSSMDKWDAYIFWLLQ